MVYLCFVKGKKRERVFAEGGLVYFLTFRCLFFPYFSSPLPICYNVILTGLELFGSPLFSLVLEWGRDIVH